MNNLSAQTTSFLTTLLETQILPDLVKYLNQREGVVTVDELMSVVVGDFTKRAPLANTKVPANANQPKKCTRKIGRGQQPTRECGKNIVGDGEFCKTCSTKKPAVKKPKKESKNQLPIMDCEVYDEELNLFVLQKYDYVVEKYLDHDEEKIKVVGKLVAGEIVKLSEDEIVEAREQLFEV